jgi:hypothetical protein
MHRFLEKRKTARLRTITYACRGLTKCSTALYVTSCANGCATVLTPENKVHLPPPPCQSEHLCAWRRKDFRVFTGCAEGNSYSPKICCRHPCNPSNDYALARRGTVIVLPSKDCRRSGFLGSKTTICHQEQNRLGGICLKYNEKRTNARRAGPPVVTPVPSGAVCGFGKTARGVSL